MNHLDFLAGYRAGRITFSVHRPSLGRVASDHYDNLFQSNAVPRRLNRLATASSLLIIPCLIGAVALPFFTAWWAFIPCLGVGVFFLALSSRFQGQAVRELALLDSNAFAFFRLEGVIVIKDNVAK